MNRKLKNILIILAIFIVIGLSYLTMKAANDTKTKIGGQENIGRPPETSASGSDSEQTGAENDGTLNKPNENENGTPPSKPEGESNNQPMGEKPDDNQPSSESKSENSETQSSNQEKDMQMPANKPSNENAEQKETKIETVYYVLFAIEAIIVSALIVYLAISNFNLKLAGEIFNEKIKIFSYIIIVILLGTGLTFLQVYCVNNVFNKNSTEQQQAMPGNGGVNSTNSNVTYTAVKTIEESETVNGENITSSTANENGILASGEIESKIEDTEVTKSGDSNSGDTSNFYGNNSAILAKDKAILNLDNVTVTTDADGANGVFSYGGSATTNNSESDGTTVNISNSKITTTGDNAGGIMTTGGGNMNATNLTINTSGTSSAAIRTDRGGGTVTVNKGTYKTTGKGSPTIYSTANVTVSNASLIANASEGVVIEGANSVELNNCNLTDTNNELNGQSTTYKNIFLYQSMSGDASNGTASFVSKNSNITTNKGDTFYVTNTTASIELTNNTIVNNDSTGNFLRIQKDSWGKTGSNGGNVSLKMENQEAKGNIVVDSISSLDMEISENSLYEGTINGENQAKSIVLKLDKTSKIKLTGDSYITSLEDEDSSYGNIDFNGYTLYVNGNAIN